MQLKKIVTKLVRTSHQNLQVILFSKRVSGGILGRWMYCACIRRKWSGQIDMPVSFLLDASKYCFPSITKNQLIDHLSLGSSQTQVVN